MSDMRGKNSAESRTATNTLTIEIGDENDHPHGPGHKDIFVYKYDFKGNTLPVSGIYFCSHVLFLDKMLMDKTFNMFLYDMVILECFHGIDCIKECKR